MLFNGILPVGNLSTMDGVPRTGGIIAPVLPVSTVDPTAGQTNWDIESSPDISIAERNTSSDPGDWSDDWSAENTSSTDVQDSPNSGTSATTADPGVSSSAREQPDEIDVSDNLPASGESATLDCLF